MPDENEKPPECHWKRAGAGLIPLKEPDSIGIGSKPTKGVKLDVLAQGKTVAIIAESASRPALDAFSSKVQAINAEGEKGSGVVAVGRVWGVVGKGGKKGGNDAGGVRGTGVGKTPGVLGI